MRTPKTDEEVKRTPREGVEFVEASFARELEKRLRTLVKTAGRRMMADEPTADERIDFMDAWRDSRDFLSANK